MVSVVSVLKGCHSAQLLPSLLSDELLGHMLRLFMYSLSPRQWEALILWLKSTTVRGATPQMSLSLKVREVVGASLIPWHMLIAWQMAEAGKVAWTQFLGKRRKCSWHLAAPMKLWEISTSRFCREIYQPTTTGVRNGTHSAKVLNGEKVERTLMFW